MTTLTIAGADVRTLFSHLALYGLAAIVEDAGTVSTRLRWTPGMQPRPCLDTGSADLDDLVRIVHDHARRHAADTGWVAADLELGGTPRGLMSPRISVIGDSEDEWLILRAARHGALDHLTADRALLDLRFLQALGEPAYWARDLRKPGDKSWLQDNGASRLEMQSRNSGAEFVRNKLRKLAQAVAVRDHIGVRAGLAGERIADEIGGIKPGSRTPTGLANPGPTDNALAWCALWGISQFPQTPRVGSDNPPAAATTCHFGRVHAEWFYTPVWTVPWTSSRLRTVLASRQLQTAATAGLPPRWAAAEPQIAAARAWLAARGVVGVIRFQIDQVSDGKAAEPRAMRGDVLPVEAL
ncbi:hypothetical protein [Kineosporia sp. A_224]|uniref:hypothetical protein n=1 Tax=Kineosporia sp. A_224 TaxID=1962180 RepID=UPI000B4BBE85|nr:hypothetical protein [Kineosporia sp. A_224]